MAKISTPLTDKRWQALAIKYRYNWVEAALNLFGRVLTNQQIEVVQEVRETGCAVTIRSGHGTGKSDLIAAIAIIYVLCYPNSRVLLASNKLDQTIAGVMKYVKIHWLTLTRRYPWLKQYFEVGHKSFNAKCAPGVWGLFTKSYKPGLEESLAGEHGEHLLWILDEASAMPDRVFSVITGSLTQLDNRIVLMSQPTRQSGYYYDSHHKLSIAPGNPNGIYKAIALNSEMSPLVTRKWLRMKARELGGTETDDYRIKVRGEFGSGGDSGMLLTRDELIAGQQNRPLLTKDWGWLAVADVGDGGDQSVLVIGRVCGYGIERVFIPVKCWLTNLKALAFARFINAQCDPELYPGISIAVDAGGVGGPTCDELDELGRSVQRILWGNPCWSDSDKKRFINRRAAACVWTRDAILSGRMRVPGGTKIVDQGSRIPYTINESSQYVIMSKKNMKKEGLGSPDFFDALCYVSLAGYTPLDRVMSEDAQEQRSANMQLYERLMSGDDADDGERVPELEDNDLWAGESDFDDPDSLDFD